MGEYKPLTKHLLHGCYPTITHTHTHTHTHTIGTCPPFTLWVPHGHLHPSSSRQLAYKNFAWLLGNGQTNTVTHHTIQICTPTPSHPHTLTHIHVCTYPHTHTPSHAHTHSLNPSRTCGPFRGTVYVQYRH